MRESNVRRASAVALICLACSVGLFATTATSGHYTWSLSSSSMAVGINNTFFPCVPTLDGNALPAGTEIAVVNSAGVCIGATKWLPGQTNSIAVQGYDSTCGTSGCIVTPGLKANQKLAFRMWDSLTQSEITMVSFHFIAHRVSPVPVTADSLFSSNGFAFVDTLRGISAPPAPPLTSPANAAVNQPTALTLSWGTSANATSYGIQVSAASTFGSTVAGQTGIAGTSLAISGLANSTTYYWEANASGSTGTGTWGAVWSFTTMPVPPPAPALSTPTNGSINLLTSQTLNWAASSGATSYTVQVSQSAAFASTILSQSQTGTSLAFSGANATTYYWRVNASNANPTPGAWSTIWTFAIIPPVPGAPTLTSPVIGMSNVPINPAALAWNTVQYATNYNVLVSVATDFSSTVASQTVSAGSASITGLANSTVYYWRANASNIAGTGNWSTTWSFTSALATPLAPALSAPSNGTSPVTVPVALSWTTSLYAATYTVQVSSSNSFATTVYQNSGSGLTASVSGLAGSTTYYWHASGVNASAIGPWSSVWSFVTPALPAAPVVPVALSFTINANNNLTWQASSGAASYGVQVSTSSAFGTTIFQQTGITGVSISVALGALTRYYYKVNATNGIGTGAWSNVVVLVTTGVANGIAADAKTAFSVKSSMITYSLSKSSPVEIVFYDMLGKTAFAMNRVQTAGSYNLAIRNCHLVPGRYILRFKGAGIEKRASVIVDR